MTRLRSIGIGAGVAALALLTGCTATGESDPTSPTPEAALPSAHVHGVGINPADDRVYLATHEGLFDMSPSVPERVGPIIDLMGFAVAGPDHFYASGHPGPGSDLPNPVGLIESTDGGKSWAPVSRSGVSDFHALAASPERVVGFDGSLVTSQDGVTWTTVDTELSPFGLAVSPSGATVLATTPSGVLKSEDGGVAWAPLAAPVFLFVSFADDTTIVGMTPNGEVHISRDGGVTWERAGGITGDPYALTTRIEDSSLLIVAATSDGLYESSDSGLTFALR